MYISDKMLYHYLKIAKKTALLSGKFLKKNFKKNINIEKKGIRDIVTEIDKKSESLIKENFSKYSSEINFFGEETGGQIKDLTWVVDPLDGTKNYVHKIPYFGVSIALCNNESPVLGVVYFPMINKLFWAIRGKGAFCKTHNVFKRLNVSQNDDISQSFIATGFPHSKSHLVSNYIIELEKILKNVAAVRRLGSAAFDLCSVAEGTFDAFWEYGLESWDMAAGAIIAKEAGAIVCQVNGDDWNIKSNSIFVANPMISNRLKEIIS